MTHMPLLSLHGVEAISYNSRSHLVSLQDKANSAHCIAQLNSVPLPFLRQEHDVLFQHDNACPHTAVATQRTFLGVQQLTWPARTLDL